MNKALDMNNWFVSDYGQFSTFSKNDIDLYRDHANAKYVYRLMENADDGKVQQNIFLNTDEELLIVQYYESHLDEFQLMNKPLPTCVKQTAFQLYKRFYLMTSVMDYHPKEMLMACVFLACKLSDYTVPSYLFVLNFERGRRNLMKTFLFDQETELLNRLKFNLTIHSPHQFISRILYELRKQRTPERLEQLVEHVEWFLESMWFTDVCLLYTPPYIALAAVMYAVERCKENIDDFVAHKVLATCPTEDQRNHIMDSVRDLQSIVYKWDGPLQQEDTTEVEKKLAVCRNPRNDPASSMFLKEDD